MKGEGGSSYGHLPEFSNIQDPHLTVHSTILSCMEIIADDNWSRSHDLMEQLYMEFSEAEQASIRLMSTLDKIVEQQQNVEGYQGIDYKRETEVDLF